MDVPVLICPLLSTFCFNFACPLLHAGSVSAWLHESLCFDTAPVTDHAHLAMRFMDMLLMFIHTGLSVNNVVSHGMM